MPIITSNIHEYYYKIRNRIKFNIRPDTAYIQTQEYIYNNVEKIQQYWQKNLELVESANDINPLLSKAVDINSYKHVSKPLFKDLEIKGELMKRSKIWCSIWGDHQCYCSVYWHKFLKHIAVVILLLLVQQY